ncbi:MAG: hypothetical protein GY950_12535 [bacterium]|nr:hypothetical protein [bacterium]
MIVKVLCHFPIGELLFATENIQSGNIVHPQDYVPSNSHDGSGKIILTSPAQSGGYSHGDTITIAWETTGITGDVIIRLKPDIGIIDTVPYDSSPYVYTFPDTISTAENYVRVKQDSTGYWSSSPIFRVLPAGNWQNRIITISSLNLNIGEDKSYEISGMTIEFNDTDRFFRDMMSGTNRFIAGNKVELFTEDGQLIYTGTVEKWQFTEDAFVLSINDKLSGLDTLIPGIISKEDFPNMVEKADGEPIPVIYGYVTAVGGAVKCVQVDNVVEETVEKGVYLLARHHCLELVDNKAYMEDAGEVPGGAALDNGADGYAYVKCAYDPELENIFVNVKGHKDEYDQLIEDPIEAIRDLINTYTDMDCDQAGMNAAQVITNARGYKIAGVIGEQKNLQDVLVDFSFSFDCDFYLSKGNEVMVTLLDWSALVPVKSYIESQIISFQIEELPDEIRNKVKYMYRCNFAKGEFQRMPVYTKDSSIVNWGEFYNRNEALNLTYVYDDDSAFDVVQRFVIQRKNPRRVAHIDIPLSEFVGLDISDIIEIQHSGAIDQNKRKYHIRRINIDFVSDTVQVEAVDITTLAGGMFLLGDRQWLTEIPPGETEPKLKPKWSNSDEFSRNYGYLADQEDWYFGNDTDYGKVLY